MAKTPKQSKTKAKAERSESVNGNTTVNTFGDETVEQAETVEQVEPDNTIAFDDAVALGKDFAQALNQNEWELGRLADRIRPADGESSYGKRTMEKFADAIDLDLDKVLRCRSVFRAYKGTPIEGASPKFAVAQALQAHPDRVNILLANPDLTMRKARAMMNEYREANGHAAQEPATNENATQEPATNGHDTTNLSEATPDQTRTIARAQTGQQKERWTVTETRRWFDDAMEAARKTFKFGHPAQERLDPDILRAAVADLDQLVSALRKSAAATTTLADAIEAARASVPAPPPPAMWEDAAAVAG